VSAGDVVAVVLWIGVIAYAVFGGADFGAGFWDLVAGGARRGERPRALIDHALAPVWEANHVWLIFCLVVLWTAFPRAFTAIMTTLTVPLLLAVLGIVARGAGFAFRKVSFSMPRRRVFGAAFAMSSVVTPFAMGTVAGGIASGRVPLGNAVGNRVTSWLNPTSIMGGTLAVATCAYLAGIFLAGDARRFGDGELCGYFTRRAIGAAAAAGLVALAGIFILHADDRRLFDRLSHRALPVVIVSVACGLGALVLLLRDRALRWAQVLAVVAVAAVVAAWGVAQYPDLLPRELTIDQAASSSTVLAWVLAVAAVAVVLIVPSLALLYTLDQQSRLEDDTAAAEDVT
jgi:cytochrome bd ubiquinol oxidase subunit II